MMHTRWSSLYSAIIIVVMFSVSAWSKHTSGFDTNLFVILAFIHCVGLPLLGFLLLFVIAIKPPHLAAGIALGIYLTLTGLALAAIALLWAGSDNSFIFLPFEGGLTGVAGLLLLILGIFRACRARVPLKSVLNRLALGIVAAMIVALWLVWRGPGDWSTTFQEVRLFSMPVVIGAIAVGSEIYRIAIRA